MYLLYTDMFSTIGTLQYITSFLSIELSSSKGGGGEVVVVIVSHVVGL